MTNPDDDLATRIMASIAALPAHEQTDAILAFVGSALKEMPVEDIHKVRAEIAAQFPKDVPIVEHTLNLIDGHLALRTLLS